MVEENGSKLPVLIFDVVLYGCLARPAQLIHLLQVVLVGFNLLIVVLLKMKQYNILSLQLSDKGNF